MPAYRLGSPLTVKNGGITMRVGEDARRCVVFFGVPSEKSPIEYGGTGFLASYDDAESKVRSFLIVTCRHVARALEDYADTGFWIRVNTKDGGSELLPISKIDWRYHPDPAVDVAVTTFPLNTMIKYDHTYLNLNKIALYSRGHTVRDAILAGDPINIVGLFRLHAGSTRNIPFVHSGQIAVLPNPDELVPVRSRTGEIIHSEVYLIEAQTLEGLSGSPVFFHQMLGFANHGQTPKAICPWFMAMSIF
jgi:hypothetical protein